MSGRLEINRVNRHEANWDPKTLFSGFTIRAVMTETDCVITRIQERSRLAKRLSRDIGAEGEDWLLQENPRTDDVEVYLKSSGPLIMWKLQDHESFNQLFDRVEQHVDELDEIRDDQE